MDKFPPGNVVAKRIALAAMLACVSTAIHADDRSPLQTVPDSDVISFRSPSGSVRVPSQRGDIAQTGGTLADLIVNSHPGTVGKAQPAKTSPRSVSPGADTDSAPAVSRKQTQDLRTLLREDPASEPAIGNDASVTRNTFEIPGFESPEQPSGESMRAYIAPESLAEMVRAEKPRVEPDLHSISLHNEDVDSLFPLPSMEIHHTGNPVQQDALTIKNPRFQSTMIDEDSAGMIEALSQEAYANSLDAEDRAKRVADSQGFEMFAMQNLSPPKEDESLLESEAPNINAAIHANRLRELSAIALRDARSRLQRRATHSARKFANEGLRLAIDVEDSLEGSNQHARDLQIALNAIRESKDFGGIGGSVNTRTMKRMVAVHETEALKDQDLSTVSSIRATEIYLDLARGKLIEAGTGSRLAAEAMLLLGMIEKQMPDQADAHSSSVCLTFQGAATEIAPGSPGAHREYGKTLLQQGFAHQAVASLNRSIALHPTRESYRSLLEASRRIGDIEVARKCLSALDDPQLIDNSIVKQLPPGAFAASYRPTPATMSTTPAKNANQKSKPSSARSDSPDDQPSKNRLGFRSLFSFGRR